MGEGLKRVAAICGGVSITARGETVHYDANGDRRHLVLGVDAGSSVSSFVLFDPNTQRIVDKRLDIPNDDLLALIGVASYSIFAFEKLMPFGFAVGKEIFDTIEWNGRFRHAADIRKDVTVYPITRKQIVVFFTGKATGGDAAVRAAMRERFGTEVVKTCTYDQTSALAVATFASDHMNLSVPDKVPNQRPTRDGKTTRPAETPNGGQAVVACEAEDAASRGTRNSLSGGVATSLVRGAKGIKGWSPGDKAQPDAKSKNSAPPAQSFPKQVSATSKK